MKKQIKYQWTLEFLEDGDIIDNNFSDKLTFDKSDLKGNDLGIVMDSGNDYEGTTDRYWAYVKDGKLPGYFSDSRGTVISIKVPARFHNELYKYLNS